MDEKDIIIPPKSKHKTVKIGHAAHAFSATRPTLPHHFITHLAVQPIEHVDEFLVHFHVSSFHLTPEIPPSFHRVGAIKLGQSCQRTTAQ